VSQAATHTPQPEAHAVVQLRALLLRVPRVLGRDEREGAHGAGVHALAAPVARGAVHRRQEVRRVDGVQAAEPLLRDHHPAAAAAAVADERDAAADVLAELHEPAAPKVMQMSIGASQASPRCYLLCWR